MVLCVGPNDVVPEFAGTAVAKAAELRSTVERTAPGDPAVSQLRRKGKDRTVTAPF